jgi:holin-like protein
MLQGLTLIFICQLAGEALVRLLGVPVPGPVAGMVILLLGLVVAGGPPEPRCGAPARPAGLPAAVFRARGRRPHRARRALKADWFPILLAIVGSTLLTMLLVGWLIARYAEPEEAPG